MKNAVRILSIAAVFSLALYSVGAGQMMGGMDNSSAKKSDSTSKHNMMSMMNNMSSQCKMMNNDFQKLDENFNKMMQMNDLNDLKAAMKKHYAMMRTMHEKMSKQQSMCKNMMSMMNSGDSKGMMGMKGSDSQKSADHSEHH